MKKNKFLFKLNIFLKIGFVLVMVGLFNLNVYSVSASWFKLSNGVSVMNDILDNLGVNKAELKYGIQSFNSSRRKKSPPEVSLTFTPLNPINGEKITATATPTYFLNDSKDLYYTWFLKSKNCDQNDSPSQKEKEECDLNGDDVIDIYDYKIKAMRIVASNGFEWDAPNVYTSDNDNDEYQASYGGDDQAGKNDYCYIHNTKSGDEYKIDCDHLFAHPIGEVTGDKSFGLAEENFWHTDPNSDDTAGTGNVDEANVAGLGINKFTWNYEDGDEVGVVVEGVSIESSQTDDSSFRTMWAMPKKMCDVSATINDYPKKSTQTISIVDDSPNIGETTTITQTTTKSIDESAATIATIKTVVTTTTTVTDSNTGKLVSTSSTSSDPTYATANIANNISITDIDDASDLNDCLYDNLINPAKSGTQGNKLDINLSYSPKTPINDSSGADNGDELTITSSIPTVNDTNYLHYQWEVYQADDANPQAGWGNALTKNDLPDSSQTIGIGLKTFKFKLNLANPKKYIRVKLTVREKKSGKTLKQGNTDIVIPVNSTSDQIEAYPVNIANINNSLNLSLGSNQLCQNATGKIICPVAKDNIIGIKVANNKLTDFSWTIDGKPFTYQECFFNGCNDDKQINVAYFPILKNIGESYVVSLEATDQSTGDKINLSRTFIVVDPTIKISSDDKNVCKPITLGQYIGLDGKKYDDLSKINFQAKAGEKIKLKIDSTGFSPSVDKYAWLVDGQVITQATAGVFGFNIDNNGVLTLPSKEEGENYDVSASILYSQSDLTKQALNKYWGVSYNQFYEKLISDTITIKVIDPNNFTLMFQGNNKKIMANIYSALPTYLNFLLKLVLTAFILLFGSGFILKMVLKEK